MVVIMASEQDLTTEEQSLTLFNGSKSGPVEEKGVAEHVGENGGVIIRSVAMSANVANSVWQEVNHLIHVNTGFCLEGVAKPSRDLKSLILPDSAALDSVCSAILPKEHNVILAVVLSRWDDIVGPQTVHMWLQKGSTRVDEMVSYSPISSQDRDSLQELSMVLKAVHYVTCHTVNCTSVSASSGASSLFVVPDLDMVAMAHLFHTPQGNFCTPYSLAVVSSFNHYPYLLERQDLLQQWLKRLSHRFNTLLKESCDAQEVELDSHCSDWAQELCMAMVTTNLASLGPSCWDILTQDVLSQASLPQALTSHLQTFGCSLVIGRGVLQVNSLIVFLALFLEEQEVCCSRLVSTSGQSSFNMGLYLQGLLLLDGSGYREISSADLAANRYPVTTIDLTRSKEDAIVKQTPLYHKHLDFQQQELASAANRSDGFTKSLLCPIKERSHLVLALLKELTLVPVRHWHRHIKRFKNRVTLLAHTLIRFAHRDKIAQQNRSVGSTLASLKKMLSISEADFFVILAQAEKIKPGLYCHIMKSDKLR